MPCTHRCMLDYAVLCIQRKTTRMKVLVIIPAYNEEACLEGAVNALTSTCPDVDYVIVNDGSSDRTAEIIQERGFNGINLPVNTGLTSGFKAGMKYALRNGYDAAVQYDADGQHLPTFIPTMAEALERGDADIVIASRVLSGEEIGGLRGVGSKLISLLIRMTAHVSITDPTSGMRMYSSRMIKRFATSFDCAPEPDTIALAARKGFKVIEVPAQMQERQGGESYLNISNAIGYMARTCLSILMSCVLR